MGKAMEAHKKAMMKSKWGIKMNNEIDKVSEIVRMFRLLDPYDQSLTKGLLDQITDIEKLKVKKVSPSLHEKA